MVLIFMLIFGVISAAIASSKGRSGIGWFFIGFFFGLIGLIGSLVVSDLGAERSQRQAVLDSNRRLREQLRQEKLKNQRFREHALRRIDAHDRTLGVDTRRSELSGPSSYRYLGTEEASERTRRDRSAREGARRSEADRDRVEWDLDLDEPGEDPNEPRQLHWT